MHRSPIAPLLAFAAVLCASPPAAAAHDDILLSADELSAALGADLSVEQWELSSPNGPSLTTPQECRAASNATTTLVYGATWTSYQGASYADGEGNDYHVVAGQIVGVFPTEKAASDVFAVLTKGLRSCGSKTSVEHRPGSNLTWRNAVDQIAATTASWHSLLDNRPRWRCSLAAQLSNNAVVEASVCRFVDPSSPASANALAAQVKAIANELVDRAS